MNEISLPMIAVTLYETLGWLSVGLALIYALLILMAINGLWRAGKQGISALRVFFAGVSLSVMVAVILIPVVPIWTMAPLAGIHGPVDAMIAFALGLIPGSLLGLLWVFIAPRLRAQVSPSPHPRVA